MTDEGAADRVVLSYPADLSKHATRRITQEYYRTYLRRVKAGVAAGDVWEEFTDVGCCGSGTDVTLRVETVEGGDRVGDDTAFAFVEREADDDGVESAWAAQYDEPDPV